MTTHAVSSSHSSPNVTNSVMKLESADIQLLIEQYQLQAHPEGGYFREVYRATQTVQSTRVNATRQAATHIYFLLTAGQFSRFHRVQHDELWHFYAGAPLRLLTYHQQDQAIHERYLGQQPDPKAHETTDRQPPCDYMVLVPAGDFQAAESTGAYSLVGCTVAPGFDFADFAFLSPTEANTMRADFPNYQRFIG
ncbi:MAG: cupin domain-containing protein [bacterium]